MFADASTLSTIQVMIGSAVFLIVCGLGICFLSKSERGVIMTTLYFWVGRIIAAIGLLFILIRVLLWIAKQLSEATGVAT